VPNPNNLFEIIHLLHDRRLHQGRNGCIATAGPAKAIRGDVPDQGEGQQADGALSQAVSGLG